VYSRCRSCVEKGSAEEEDPQEPIAGVVKREKRKRQKPVGRSKPEQYLSANGRKHTEKERKTKMSV
jgi:hypothetical protein